MQLMENLGSWVPSVLSWTLGSNGSTLGEGPWQEAMTTRLSSLLSPNASIHWPGDDLYATATERWQVFKSPKPAVAVRVATENDVSQTVKFANSYGVPFLATSGGFGYAASLGDFQGGIQIWMRGLNSVTVDEDGQTANIGGGVSNKEVTDALWPLNKLTVTGLCECTSLVGGMLGGGHGWMQGYYGLAADNWLEARVVLADGTAVTVSPTSHPDLNWALRGAGHNYGIVTEVKYKIYDNTVGGKWSLTVFLFTRDKVEEVFSAVNDITREGKQRKELMVFAYFIRMPQADPENAIIYLTIFHEGEESNLKDYTAPFENLNPLHFETHTVPYNTIPDTLLVSMLDQACEKGSHTINFPVSMQRYEPSRVRKLYDAFNEFTRNKAYGTSHVILEGYSVEAVQAVPEESTAFPDRFNNLLVAIYIVSEENNPSFETEAYAAGQKMRETIMPTNGKEGNRLYSYINYARGTEPLEELYGYEPWRLERLKAVKAAYDPKNQFRYYGPIIRS